MLASRKTARLDSGPNMTPLVDVVMVILIFLMLAGSFGGAEHYLAANFSRGAAQRDTRGGGLDAPVDIRVEAAPQGGYVARVGPRAFTNDDKGLTAGLADLRRKVEAAGVKGENAAVVISPGRTVKYNLLIAVYQAALEAGFQRISFATAR